MSSTFKPRKYYCAQPITATCRKGFVSRGGWIRHRDAVHASSKNPRARPRQHPYQPPRKQLDDIDSEENQEDDEDSSDIDLEAESNMVDSIPVGAYYVTHPVLDGEFYLCKPSIY